MKNIFAIAFAIALSTGAYAQQANTQGDFERHIISPEKEMTQFLEIAERLQLLDVEGLEAAIIDTVDFDQKFWNNSSKRQKEVFVRQVVQSIKEQ